MTHVEHQRLRSLVAATKYVLLDFDGPVCDLFSALSPDVITAALLDELQEMVGGPVDEELAGLDDPLDLLDGVSEIYPALTSRVDSGVRDAEVDAAGMATTTPGAVGFLEACAASGRPVAIVSNNGAEAVRAFLAEHDLAGLVRHVQGRDPDPRLMKPDPTPLVRAMQAIGADPRATTMIGDSSSDLLAARACGIEAIGLVDGQAGAIGMEFLAELFTD